MNNGNLVLMSLVGSIYSLLQEPLVYDTYMYTGGVFLEVESYTHVVASFVDLEDVSLSQVPVGRATLGRIIKIIGEPSWSAVRGAARTPLEPSTAVAPVHCCYWEWNGAVPCTESGVKITFGMYAITLGMLVVLLLGLNMS